ncbi:hypothetical protein BDQ17DRAFT_1483259 [Cyathus striatus]|nr:hypothetical protein BDQ17DRAFT_1483259 [Cyathus striatus]
MAKLMQDIALLTYSMEMQMQKLVIEPLTDVSMSVGATHLNDNSTADFSGNDQSIIPHLVIIDGLDECKGTQVQSRIITMLSSIVNMQSMHIQFLITSRPELKIRNTFSSTDHSVWTGLVLDDHYDPDKDINKYLQSEFSAIKRNHTLATSLSNDFNWPSQNDIGTLVKRSSGQFIYASSVIKYIHNDHRNPKQRLSTIIDLHPAGDLKGSPYAELDALYYFILLTATENMEDHKIMTSIFQAKLYTYDTTSQPKSVLGLSNFLGIDREALRLSLADLHSIMIIPDSDDSEIKFLHASFSDFLMDTQDQSNFSLQRKMHMSLLDIFAFLSFNTFSNLKKLMK